MLRFVVWCCVLLCCVIVSYMFCSVVKFNVLWCVVLCGDMLSRIYVVLRCAALYCSVLVLLCCCAVHYSALLCRAVPCCAVLCYYHRILTAQNSVAA